MLRFPIDRGVIKISCKCGSSIIIDPDDTELYKEGKFDLTKEKKENKNKKSTPSSKSAKSAMNKKFSYSRLINSLFELKYKLQNLPVMPDKERNKILLYLLTIIVILILILFIIIK